MDYRQNGLVLPKNRKNLEILLKDVHQKGFLDIELLYQLKEKEAVRDVEKEIVDKLNDNDEINEQKKFYRTFKKAFVVSLN
jgi:hypothetical protein